MPLSVLVLTLLFAIQKHGTATVGKLFAPIMLTWFITLAVLGLNSIFQHPEVLGRSTPSGRCASLPSTRLPPSLLSAPWCWPSPGWRRSTPTWAILARARSGAPGLWWCCPLWYSTTSARALLLAHPEAITNPFFLLAPKWALLPLLLLATLATVIASQAVISGVFSLTRQAVRLGYLSPIRIVHTSEQESGQIYIPVINWMLYISVVIVIMSFEHSSNLAAACGIAVTGTMVLTSILSCSVARHSWHWNKYLVAALFIALLAIDVPLFAANLAKIFSGGWLPLTLGAVMFTVMTSWKSERFQLIRRLNEHGNSLEPMIASLENPRRPGWPALRSICRGWST